MKMKKVAKKPAGKKANPAKTKKGKAAGKMAGC